jgi:hypothetical protein
LFNIRYAFAYTAEPDKIYTNRSWPRTPGGGKTLTAILLKRSDLSVVAFGYEAREKNTQNEGNNEYLYFANFKMTLHGTGLRGQVKASNCDFTIPTEQLISICIGVIIERAMDELNTSATVRISRAEIRWVVTVPAIWVSSIILVAKSEEGRVDCKINRSCSTGYGSTTGDDQSYSKGRNPPKQCTSST